MAKFFSKVKALGKRIASHPAIKDLAQQAKDSAKAAAIEQISGYKRGGRVKRRRMKYSRVVRRVRRRRG